jgi:hypothetical protein
MAEDNCWWVYPVGERDKRQPYQTAFSANLAAFWMGLKTTFPNPLDAKPIVVESPWR